ncbi:MAG: hypothetical protein J6B95_05330 [Oscillospiraceae bacterium]|nr:hypothetical protein [Oscillospiraceae bacterium]
MFDSKLYKETFSQVHASEETLAEVVNMTKKYQNNYLRRGARMLLIAAVVTCLLATTAFAYVGFTQYENPMELLATFFGDGNQKSSDGQIVHETYFDLEYDLVQPTIECVPLDEKTAEEDVAPYVSGVGESVTNDGDKLTVEAHLYDSTTDCGIIYYNLENSEGVSGYELQFDGEVWWPGGEKIVVRNCHGKNYIVEGETTDTKLSVAHYYCGIYGEEPYIEVGFSEGNTALYLPLNGSGMDAVSFAGGDIKLSAIGISIDAGDMEFLRKYDTDGTYLPPMTDNIDSLVISFRDGSEYVVDKDGEEQVVRNYSYCINMEVDERTYSFNRLIDIEEVVAVIINEYEYAVTE